jgi:hypothetical protein
MPRFMVGAFIMVHGLVHLLYFGQSRRLFELQPGMVWPDGSWAFSRLVGDEASRWLASASCPLDAIAFLAGGMAILAQQAWWRWAVVGAAAFSSIVVLLFWDGKLQRLDDQGGIALLIKIAILAAALVPRWPNFEF